MIADADFGNAFNADKQGAWLKCGAVESGR